LPFGEEFLKNPRWGKLGFSSDWSKEKASVGPSWAEAGVRAGEKRNSQAGLALR
jgi:hypothetical protein